MIQKRRRLDKEGDGGAGRAVFGRDGCLFRFALDKRRALRYDVNILIIYAITRRSRTTIGKEESLMGKIYNNVTELIGHTPLLKANHFINRFITFFIHKFF